MPAHGLNRRVTVHAGRKARTDRNDDRRIRCLLYTSTQPLCRVILVQKTRLQLPDVKLLLTHRKQHRNVLRGDDVALAEARRCV